MTLVVIGLYLLFLIVFGVMSFFALYQLWQFGYVGDASKKAIILYIIVSLSIIVVSFFLFASSSSFR